LAAAQQLQVDTNQAVTQAELTLQTKGIDANQKADALAVAKDAVDQAQANYDNILIGTPIDNGQPTIPGLQADIYTYDSQYYYPERLTTTGTLCKIITVDNIDKDWGGGDIEGCGGDFVMIHYTGYLTVPTTNTYEFLAQVDDGWYLTLDDMVINDNWVLKGCGGWWSQPTQLQAGHSYKLDAWFYEYGGGACNQLLYLDNQNWGVVPSTWFSQNEQTPMVYTKNPALLALLEQAQAIYSQAQADYDVAQNNLTLALEDLRSLQNKQLQNQVTIDVASQDVTNKQEELRVSQQELQAIPSFTEPTPTPSPSEEPTKEPETVVTPEIPKPVTPTPTEPTQPELPVNVETVNPQSLTTAQVQELKKVANEILNNSEQGSPEYEQALTALFVAAQADDIVVNEELAAVPVLGATVVALADAVNFLGNAGADMSPKVREESKKIVVTAVVAVGAAVNAATGAALTAAAPSAGGASNNIRRKE
jgi:hypothetical protein